MEERNSIHKRAVHKAVEKNDINMLELLLSYGISVDTRDRFTGYTPLHVAIKLKNYLLAFILLRRGADVNKITKSGATSLHLAIETGDEVMAYLTISHGVNINIKRFDKSPLYLAAEVGLFNVVEILLEKGCDVNDVTSIGKTAIHIAVETRNPKIVNLLLDYNARCDLKVWGKCPLSLAVSDGSYEIVLLLLNKRVSNVFYCRDVHTAMYLAFQQKNEDIVYAFMKYHIDPNWRLGQKSLLHFAVEYQWENVVKILLEKGADSSLVTSDNNSVLYAALRANNSNIVEMLLDYGANVNIQLDYSGDTPLHLAIRNNCLVSVCSLLENGANPNIMNSQKCTPLQLAFDLHHRDIICNLLKFDGNLMAPKYGKSLLEIAVECEWLNLTAQLLREGADANMTGSENVSLLVMAIKQNNIEMIQLLLRYGADIHAVDQKYSMTPLLFAAAHASVAVTKFLLQRGANINYTTSQGITALMVAMAKQRDKDMVLLLLEYGAATDVGGLSKQLILSIAVECNWLKIAEMMIVQGAEVNQCSRSLFKSLNSSVRTGNTYVANILAKYATDVWQKSICRRTLIYTAATYSSAEMVELLLKHGATIDSLNFNELSPLFAAFKRKNEHIISILIESGCCINTKSELEQTPLHLAATYGCAKAVSMMLARGAQIEAVDAYGKTPLYYAVSFSHIEITKLLLKHDRRTAASREHLYNSLVCAVSLKDHEMVKLLLTMGPPLVYYEEPDKTALGIAVRAKMNNNILRLLLDYDLYDSKKKLDAEDILCHVGHVASSTPIVAEWLIQHVTRKQLKVKTPDDWEIYSIPDKMQDYYEECLSEVKEMKEDTFYNKISFHTIFNTHPKRLAITLRNDKIRKKFYKSNYEVNYPIFKDALKCCMEKTVTIVERTVAAEAALKWLTKRSLPHYVMQSIFSFMSDADMQMLLGACLPDYEAWPANEGMHKDII